MKHNKIKLIKDILQRNITLSPNDAKRFFKPTDTDQFIGVNVPNIRKIAKNFSDISLDDLSELIASPINEERLLALIILTNLYKNSPLHHNKIFYEFYLNNLHHVNNWNLVDASAHLIIGAYLIDKNKDILFELAQSENLWKRRIAIVATLYFIKNEKLDETFSLAKILLNDKQDLIHKAVGWMLREAGKRNEQKLMDFLDNNAVKMPRTMLRYSIEKFNPELKNKYMTIKN